MLDDSPRPAVRCEEVRQPSCSAARLGIRSYRRTHTKKHAMSDHPCRRSSVAARLDDRGFRADRPPFEVSRQGSRFVPQPVGIGGSAVVHGDDADASRWPVAEVKASSVLRGIVGRQLDHIDVRLVRQS